MSLEMDQIILNSTNYQGCFMTHSRYCEKWEVESAYVAVGLLATHQLNVLSGAQVFQNYLSSILQI